MSLWKRGDWYWSDFTVNGQRVRQTLETTDWREAVQREHDLIEDAKQGKIASGVTKKLARLQFEKALDRYLEERKTEIQTERQERRMTKPLREFFAPKRLNQISGADIRAYQAKRLGEGRHPATVNHEVKALLRLLKRAKLASRIRDDVKLLRVQKEPRQMLTAAEKQRLFETASKKDRWATAYCAAMLTANTSMRPVELRRLRWQDLDPENRLVTVRRSKTEAGCRVIPLNQESWSSITALKAQADDLGTDQPEHYIFPRTVPAIDGSKPMGASGWKTAWQSLREEAAKADKKKRREAMPKLSKVRFYDLRHQAITEMLEAGIPEGVIREVAGHVDPAMTRYYSHPRLAARRAAVEALSIVKPTTIPALSKGSYVTKRVTKLLPAEAQAG
jgi:integrase